ncbi:TetR/AcrR family transcriptional regulator [Microbacterium sp. G2-8]|uniref:TetR/AcrR family transcriptional regulator n=1 Tax=Microbacterium sp. G2-8 TaxID=2842454 RepID=UPI001C8A011B|nr:TetR/AcrR family transcriptional regulator [Microbacterium sp. G2-8]
MADLAPRDHAMRAVLAVVADEGMEGLSVRRVGARAGLSIGAVQHHFPTKAAMVAAVMDIVVAAAEEQLDAAREEASPRDGLGIAIDARVPASSVDVLTRVWMAFAAHAAVDDATNDAFVSFTSRQRTVLAELLVAAGAPEGSARESATELLALCDGLALQVVAERGAMPPEVARRIAHARAEQHVGVHGGGRAG